MLQPRLLMPLLEGSTECVTVGMHTVLLGDAAYVVSPVGGQGLNSGLEDVMVFAQQLQLHDGNLDAASIHSCPAAGHPCDAHDERGDGII